jgi:hypothetical protein
MPAHHKNRILYVSFVSSRAQISIFPNFFAPLLACKRQAFAPLPCRRLESKGARITRNPSKPLCPARLEKCSLRLPFEGKPSGGTLRPTGHSDLSRISRFSTSLYVRQVDPPNGLQPTVRIQRAQPSLRPPPPASPESFDPGASLAGRIARTIYTTLRPEGSAYNTMPYKDLTHNSARPGGKSEIRISKSETNSKFETGKGSKQGCQPSPLAHSGPI